jgi:magnesium chelatase subunit I
MDSTALLDQLQQVEGLLEKVKHLGLGSNEPDALRASAGEFILEGLYALRRISRDEEVGFRGEARGENRGESRGEGRAAPLEDEAAEIDPLEIRRKRDRRKFN